MPLYEYKCQCGKEIKEVMKEFSKFDEVEICSCGKEMTRVYSSPIIYFKGDGWAFKEIKK